MANTSRANRPRLYLLSDSVLDRHAYRSLLEKLNCDVTVDSDFTPTAVWAALRLGPNFVLANAHLPSPTVVDAVQMIKRLHPQLPVVVLSGISEAEQIEPWSTCSLDGFVAKAGGPEELQIALKAVSEGRPYYSDGIRPALERAAARANGTAKLSRREAELLPLLAQGLTLRDAANRMSVSYKTADSYRSSLLRKLGVRDRVELARYAIRKRIIEP